MYNLCHLYWVGRELIKVVMTGVVSLYVWIVGKLAVLSSLSLDHVVLEFGAEQSRFYDGNANAERP